MEKTKMTILSLSARVCVSQRTLQDVIDNVSLRKTMTETRCTPQEVTFHGKSNRRYTKPVLCAVLRSRSVSCDWDVNQGIDWILYCMRLFQETRG